MKIYLNERDIIFPQGMDVAEMTKCIFMLNKYYPDAMHHNYLDFHFITL